MPLQIHNFGIMVNQIDMSQMGLCLVNQLNKLVDTYYNFCPIVFYKEYAKTVDVKRFCTLLDLEAWSYQDLIIATDLETALTLQHCPGPRRKLFYVWDLEWLYGNYNFGQLYNIYNNTDMPLIARSADHSNILSKYWQKPQYIMEDFDINTLRQIVTLDQTC